MIHLFKFFFILLIGFFQFSSYSISNNDIDKLAKNFIEKNKVPGMSIAILNEGQTKIYNYGYANEDEKIKTTSNTIYRINSFTKTFTATLAGIAQAEGKLKLSAPFVSYFQEVNTNENLSGITSEELLAHIASFPSAFNPSPKNHLELLHFLKTFKPPYPIGTKYKYSNYSIGIVGYLLENVYQKNYEDILNEKIVRPLDLESTYLTIPTDKEKYEAIGHDGTKKIPIRKNISVLFAAGEIKSTILDVAKFLRAQMDARSISNKELRDGIFLVHRTKFCFEGVQICQQMGWQEHAISDLSKTKTDTLGDYIVSKNPPNYFLNQETFVDKTGGGLGMSSYMLYIPNKNKGIVVLLNKNLDDEKTEFGRKILKIIKDSKTHE